VTVVDDFSVGRREFLARSQARITIVDFHVGHAPADVVHLAGVLRGHDVVFHLAANPEARWGLENTFLDLEQNTLTTWAVLEAMRRSGARRFVLASSGTIYGDLADPVGEDHGPLRPISLYGASKLASEGLASAFAACFGQRALVFRFGNVVGSRATHGAALDFIKKLEATPERLEVLGDGRQAKPYLHVSDCVAGMLFGVAHAASSFDCFNLAPEDVTSVSEIARAVVNELGSDAQIVYTGGERGWPGDVPRSRLRPDKLAALGFRVRVSSTEAMRRAVAEIVHERRASACSS
ncbi:MAG TPA: NAD-dependent epimerase/dehydratase family protein, partial [Polyangia bacterium]